MEITWYGHSCFRITERNRISVVTDPFSESIGLPVPKLKGDVVTISHPEPGHNNVEVVKGEPHVLEGPGEYELGGVFITGIPMHKIDGDIVRWNIAYLLEYDHLTVLHLGDLTQVPDQSTIESFGEVNVLLLPVGGGNALRASEAAEVVALIEPQFVVPMHYSLPDLKIPLDPLENFLKAMGIGKAQEADWLKVNSSEMLEQSQVVVLLPQFQQQQV